MRESGQHARRAAADVARARRWRNVVPMRVGADDLETRAKVVSCEEAGNARRTSTRAVRRAGESGGDPRGLPFATLGRLQDVLEICDPTREDRAARRRTGGLTRGLVCSLRRGWASKPEFEEETMVKTRAYAATSKTSPLAPVIIERREPGPNDVVIEILFCGICHSDIHQVRDEWSSAIPALYPMVPGHEIVGRVKQVGKQVTRFKAGDSAGVGGFVDSCRGCDPRGRGRGQFGARGAAWTYNGTDMGR